MPSLADSYDSALTPVPVGYSMSHLMPGAPLSGSKALAGCIKRTWAQLPSAESTWPTEKFFTHCHNKLWKCRPCPKTFFPPRWRKPWQAYKTMQLSEHPPERKISVSAPGTLPCSLNSRLLAIFTWISDGMSTPSPCPVWEEKENKCTILLTRTPLQPTQNYVYVHFCSFGQILTNPTWMKAASLFRIWGLLLPSQLLASAENLKQQKHSNLTLCFSLIHSFMLCSHQIPSVDHVPRAIAQVCPARSKTGLDLASSGYAGCIHHVLASWNLFKPLHLIISTSHQWELCHSFVVCGYRARAWSQLQQDPKC